MKRLWILGASDPEMQAIEALLAECGENVAHATNAGQRVHPRVAYDGATVIPDGVTDVYVAECDVPTPEGVTRHVIDHHRPGDPGYGRPPAEFLAASSIGQVIAELARLGRIPRKWVEAGWPYETSPIVGSVAWQPFAHGGWTVTIGSTADDRGMWYGRIIPRDLVLTAAADHCLGAAYRGECPDVDPDALMRWRVESRARFQGVDPATILAAIEVARAEIAAAPVITLAWNECSWHAAGHRRSDDCQNSRGSDWADDPCEVITAHDMRRPEPVLELPEAAARDGVAYVSGPLLDPRDPSRAKYTVSGPDDVVRAWMDVWAPAQGVTDIYGDPARGFAGGYLPAPLDEA